MPSRSTTTRRAERGREESALGAEYEPRRHRRPGIQWPGLVDADDRTGALTPHRLLSERSGHVVEETDEGIDQHARRQALRYQRASEGTERLRDDGDWTRRVPDSLHDRVGALDQSRRALDRQIGRDGVVAVRASLHPIGSTPELRGRGHRPAGCKPRDRSHRFRCLQSHGPDVLEIVRDIGKQGPVVGWILPYEGGPISAMQRASTEPRRQHARLCELTL